MKGKILVTGGTGYIGFLSHRWWNFKTQVMKLLLLIICQTPAQMLQIT